MTTTKSYSNDSRFSAIYRSALKRQLPFAIISGILFLISIVIVFFSSAGEHFSKEYLAYRANSSNTTFNIREYAASYFQQGIYTDAAQTYLSLIILAVLSICAALAAFSYMHNKKTVDLYHSLPVTRAQLLTANLLASMTAVLGPFLVMYLGTMLAQLVWLGHYGCFGIPYFSFIFFDLAGAIVYVAVIYAFIALMAVNVGTVFDAFATTMIMAWSPMMIYLVSGAIWSNMTYGASFEPSMATMLLSPFTFIFHREVALEYIYSDYKLYWNWALLILGGIAAAAVLYLAAVACYRRRKSEIAEQTQPRGVLQIIGKLVAAFVGAAGFWAIFIRAGIIGKLFAVMVGSLIIGLIAELILSRGLKSLGKNIKLLLAAGAFYCVLLLLVHYDVAGYVTRVPAPDSVASVEISYNGRFEELSNTPNWNQDRIDRKLTLPESIGIITDAHRLATQNRPDKSYTMDNNNYSYRSVMLEYKLKNGRTLKRNYNGFYAPAYIRLADLEDKDDFIMANSAIFRMDKSPILQGELVTSIELYGNVADIKNNRFYPVKVSDMQPLIDALKADLLAESLEGIQHPEKPPLGFLQLTYMDGQIAVDRGLIPKTDRYYGMPREDFVITSEYKNTIAVLKQFGMDGELENPDIDSVVQLAFMPAYDSLNMENRVSTFLPQSGSEKFELSDENRAVFVTEDRDDFKAVADVALSQFLPERKDAGTDPEYACVWFVFEQGNYSYKAVRISDLPPGLREKVEAGIKAEPVINKDYEYTIEAEKVW